MTPTPTIRIGENFSQNLTPVQTPAAGVPLTFTLNRRYSKPIPSFIVKTPSTNGSLKFDIAPIDSATDIQLWDQFYFSVTNPGIGGGACSTADFSFTVVTACTVAPFLITQSPPGAVSQLTTTNIVVANSAPPEGVGCPGSVFQANLATLTSFITWQDPDQLIVSPTLSTIPGTYLVVIGYGQISGATYHTQTLTVIVSACLVTSLTTSDVIPAQSYVIGAQAQTIPSPQFVQNPLCNEMIILTISPMPTFVSVDPTNITFSGGNSAEAILHKLVLTAKAQTSLVTTTVPLDVKAIDCTPKNLQALPDTFSVSQLNQVLNVDIVLSTDLLPVECGSYNKSLLNDQNYLFVTINGLNLNVSPLLTTVVGPYLVQAKITMQNNPYLSSSLPININVIDCAVIELTPDI